MTGFAILRLVAWVKRLALATEELARIERQRTPSPKPIKPAELSVASVDEWNLAYRRDHPELFEDADVI